MGESQELRLFRKTIELSCSVLSMYLVYETFALLDGGVSPRAT